MMAMNPLLPASGQQRIPLIPSPFEPPSVDRMEMEMHAIYQQRRIEKVNSKGLAGLGIPFIYSSSIPVGPATFHGRGMLPASDLHVHRSTLRNLPGNPMIVATGPRFTENWGQKCRRLRRGTGSQKVLDSDPESSKRQVEEKPLGQTHAVLYEENEYTKDPEMEAVDNHTLGETSEKPTTALADTCGELEPSHRKPWGAQGTPLEEKAWDDGKEKASEHGLAACGEKNGVYPPAHRSTQPGTHVLLTIKENLSLNEDIQKWTVNDVYNFISGLPGCSDYAQVFKDHAIDGETLPLLTEEHLRSAMGLKLGPALKIQSQEVGEPSKEEKAVAKFLRFNCPTKSTNMMGHRVDYFIASKAVDCLLDSKWAKAKKGEEALFTTRESVVDYCNRLLKKQFFHRALKVMKMKYEKDIKKEKEKGKAESGKEEDKKSKKENLKDEKTKKEKEKKKDGEKEESKKEETPGTPKKKETKKKFKLEPHDDQVFLDGNEVFVWIYDPVHFKTFVMGLILARCILFLIIWLITGGRHHFWFLPNLTADVGFIDSFRPLYTHEYKGPKADLKKDEKSETKKQQKSDSEEKSDSEKKEDEEGKVGPGNHGTEGSGGERHSDTDSDRREDDRSQHSSGNGNDFEMITKEELEQQTDGDCEEEEEEDNDGETTKSSHEKS
ncbi:hypothetical protein G4228_012845 [Cervus hanglu yarkandensis]|nr:hypothetical protein G4228_012845 [Cervus hanglu yarkandensis]